MLALIHYKNIHTGYIKKTHNRITQIAVQHLG